MPLDGPHPRRLRGLAVEFVGDDQANHVGRRLRRDLDQERRALVGFPAWQLELEQAAVGEQGQRGSRVPQIVPRKTAVDEEHRTVGVAGSPRRGSDGVRSLADQQRLIAGDEIEAGETASERGRVLIGI
jgi:hypothetical protein